MDEKLVNRVIQSRKSLREKLKSLKTDIAKAKRDVDIHYAPITEPLQQIITKLGDATIRPKKSKIESLEEELEESGLSPEQSYGKIPGTSILKRGTPSRKQARVSWFSPAVHSSPTKRLKLPTLVGKTKESSLAQPLFLEDVYVGEQYPETEEKKPEVSAEREELEEEESDSGSINLEKSMAHAISLLQTGPSKSIIADKSLNKTLLETDVVKESLKEYDPLVRPYLIGLVTSEDEEEFDTKYGIREHVSQDKTNSLRIGTQDVKFEGPYIFIGDFKYKGTHGLYELLFKKTPGKFTFSDVKNYKFILQNTNSYKVRYDPEGKVASSKGHKYTNIIKPILEGKPPNVWWTRNWKTGAGILTMPLKKQVIPHSKIEYKYWDSLEDLIDRLQLLIASKQAGHSAHDNEIMNIIMELKEANVIQ